MPSTKNTEPEELQKLSAMERMKKALSEIEVPLPPRDPISKEVEEMDFHEWAQKTAQEMVDNLNRNALKNG